jgi:hypothetical protein
MDYAALISLLALGLFVGMVLLLELGRRIGVRRIANDPEGAQAGNRGGRRGGVRPARPAHRLHFLGCGDAL